MSINTIKELINIMKENNLKQLEVSFANEKYKLYISNYESEIQNKSLQTQISKEIIIIKSPMVGLVYRQSSPDSKPYVEKLQSIKKGETLCMIEAMKIFSNINAEDDYIVYEICFEDGQLVEYDQPLFKVQKMR
jgi:acetyl-CoA carboxylase biotin carboxyl carrier protein